MTRREKIESICERVNPMRDLMQGNVVCVFAIRQNLDKLKEILDETKYRRIYDCWLELMRVTVMLKYLDYEICQEMWGDDVWHELELAQI